MSPIRLFVAVAAALGLVGCAPATTGRAEPAVDEFPDVADYALVDTGLFVLPDNGRFAGVVLRTQQGQFCSSNSRDYLHRVWCSGPRFDVGGYWKTTVGPDQVATVERADPPSSRTAEWPLLAPGQRIQFGDGTSCLTATDLFACRTGSHGFVFTKTGSRSF